MTTIPPDTPDWLTTPQGALDELFAYQNVSLAGGPPSSSVHNFTLSKSYQSIQLHLATASVGGVYDVYVVSLDPASNELANLHYQWSLNLSSDIIVPLGVPMMVGGTLRITLSLSSGSAVMNLAVYASVNPPSTGGVSYRSDGRPYPKGLSFANISTTAAAGDLIPAPGAGLRIMLKTLQLIMPLTVAAATQGSINVIIGGGSAALLTAFQAAAVNNGTIAKLESESGILLDDNTHAQLVGAQLASVGFYVGIATYDLSY